MNIFKDTRDVPQFYMIFLDIVFPFYLQNLLIPQNAGCITRLFSELEYFECIQTVIECL